MKTAVQKYALQPFSHENIPENCRVNVSISRNNYLIHIDFCLDAMLDDLLIPSALTPRRKDRLWDHTCFEIFLGQESGSDYREFNLSPSGEWNVYTFSDYREGMSEDRSLKVFPFNVQILSDYKLVLSFTIDCNFISVFSNIFIGVSAVLERKDTSKSYWALYHPLEGPDFHARDFWMKI